VGRVEELKGRGMGRGKGLEGRGVGRGEGLERGLVRRSSCGAGPGSLTR
jgi:hypothetical protein